MVPQGWAVKSTDGRMLEFSSLNDLENDVSVGKIPADWMVFHPTKTNGKWYTIARVPKLAALVPVPKVAMAPPAASAPIVASMPVTRVVTMPAKRGLGVIGWLLIIFGGGLFTVFLICGGLISSVVSEAEKRRARMTPEEIKAEKDMIAADTLHRRLVRLSREEILKRLKTPTTAKIDLQVDEKKSLLFVVSGNVTSQNAFGAMLTNPVRLTWGRTQIEDTPKLFGFSFEGKDIMDEDMLKKVLEAIK
jgi:hypothetical protein